MIRENWWDYVMFLFMCVCLINLRSYCEEYSVDKLVIFCLGIGVDMIDWFFVRRIFEDVFKDIDILIMVYILR